MYLINYDISHLQIFHSVIVTIVQPTPINQPTTGFSIISTSMSRILNKLHHISTLQYGPLRARATEYIIHIEYIHHQVRQVFFPPFDSAFTKEVTSPGKVR